MNKVEWKTIPGELKADNPGSFEAVFSTFNAIDADGDVTLPGAIAPGDVIVGAFGHRTDQPPIGKGVISTNQVDARVAGHFFLDTTHGRDAYETLKALGGLAQWSYVLGVVKARFGEFQGQRVRFLEQLKVFSVDPVLAAAGVNTRTTRIKSQHTAAAARLSVVDQAELEVIRVENERRMVRAELGTQRAKFHSFLAKRKAAEMRAVERGNVHPLVRIAAEKAMERAAQKLGIPAVAVKWFDRPSWSESKFTGYTYVTAPEIWIIATATPEQAAWIAYHEAKHRALGYGQRPSDEFECNRFADEMMALRAGTVTGLY